MNVAYSFLTAEMRLALVEAYRNGKTQREIADDSGVFLSLVNYVIGREMSATERLEVIHRNRVRAASRVQATLRTHPEWQRTPFKDFRSPSPDEIRERATASRAEALAALGGAK